MAGFAPDEGSIAWCPRKTEDLGLLVTEDKIPWDGKYTHMLSAKSSELGKKDCRDDPKKLRLDLVAPEMLEALGSVLTYGCGKYGPRNWEKGIPHGELFGAVQRHLLTYLKGDRTDESGLPHLWHAFTSLGMLLTMDIRRQDLDDLHGKTSE